MSELPLPPGEGGPKGRVRVATTKPRACSPSSGASRHLLPKGEGLASHISHNQDSSTMQPTDDRLRDVFNTLEPYIESRYGVPLIIQDLPDPFTGDLDGSEIHVDYANDLENAVF